MSKWIHKAIKRPGAFTRAAKGHHMSTAAFATSVLKKGSHASTRLKRQASLARTLSRLRR